MSGRRISRRKVLQSGVVGATMSVIPKVASANNRIDKAEVIKGKRSVLDLKIEFSVDRSQDNIDIPVAAEDRFVKPTHIENDRLFSVGLPYSSIDSSSENMVRVPERTKFFSETDVYTPEKNFLKTDYTGTTARCLLSEQIERPSCAISVSEGTVMIRADNASQVELEPGEEKELQLPTQEVEFNKLGEPYTRKFKRKGEINKRLTYPVIGTTNGVVDSKLYAEYHGELPFYAMKNGIIGPRGAPWLQRQLPNDAEEDLQISTVDGTNLIAVSMEGK